MAQHGVVMITLRSTDLERTERFYHEIFGWDMYRMREDYLGFDPPSGIAGGFTMADDITPGNSSTLYVEVLDFEPYLDKVVELGGGLTDAKEQVNGYGTYMVVMDPDGNRIGLWKPKSELPLGLIHQEAG